MGQVLRSRGALSLVPWFLADVQGSFFSAGTLVHTAGRSSSSFLSLSLSVSLSFSVSLHPTRTRFYKCFQVTRRSCSEAKNQVRPRLSCVVCSTRPPPFAYASTAALTP